MIPTEDEVVNDKVEEKPQTSNKNFIGKALLTASFILLSGILVYIVLKNPNVKTPPSIQPTTINKISSSPVISPSEEQLSVYLILKRKTSAGDEILYMDEGVLNKKLVRWKNYIFYGSKDYADKTQIFSHDMTNGKTTVIYEGGTEEGFDRISDIKVINNTLFFSVTGKGKASTYWLDLPKEREPQEVVGSNGYVIEKIGKNYWILDGYGDGCGSYATYALLDVETKIAVPQVQTSSGCGGSDDDAGKFVGIDKKNNMILSEHFFRESEGDVYLNLISIPVSNPSAKTTILANNDMPPDINSVLFSDDQNKLLLTGKEFYIYDLEKYTLEKIADNMTAWYTSSIGKWKDNAVCLSGFDQKGAETLLLDLTTKKLTSNSTECVAFSSENLFKEQDAKAYQLLLNELNLPTNYALVIEKRASN